MKNSDMKVIAIILSIALCLTVLTSNVVSIASVVILAKGGTAVEAGTNTDVNAPAGNAGTQTQTPAGNSGTQLQLRLPQVTQVQLRLPQVTTIAVAQLQLLLQATITAVQQLSQRATKRFLKSTQIL